MQCGSKNARLLCVELMSGLNKFICISARGHTRCLMKGNEISMVLEEICGLTM
jgi:hypothetical protein